jgi:hypothetical protein
MDESKDTKGLVSFLNMNDDGSEVYAQPVLKAVRETLSFPCGVPWVNIMSVSCAPRSSFVIH